MVSEWRVVKASTTGTIDAYLVEDFITIENLNGDRVDLYYCIQSIISWEVNK